MAGSSSVPGGRHSGAPASSRSSAMPSGGPRRISTSSGSSMSSPSGSIIHSLPRRIATTRMPDLGRELDVGERAVRERGVRAHAHPVRDLLGGGEVGDQRGGDAEPVGDDARRCRRPRCPCARWPRARAARSTSPRRRAASGPRARTPRASRARGPRAAPRARATSSAIAASPKNSAAYARSTMSSEVSFASESMALRLRGWSSGAIE